MTATVPVKPPLEVPAAWLGSELAGRPDWIHELSGPEIAELDAALEQVRDRGPALHDIDRSAFPLPTLAPTIDSWAEELDAGRGFVLVRGLPVHRYTGAEASVVYWGVGQHLGVPVSQNTAGDLLGHVRDTGADPSDPSVRLYRTRAAQPYHTDGSDVVGLLYIRFYIEQAQRHQDVPRLTPRQVELLDLIDEIAASPRFHLDMEFLPGDMQWLSNAVILHGRTAYEDDPGAPRHLLRLWLTLHRHAHPVDGGIGGIPTKEISS